MRHRTAGHQLGEHALARLAQVGPVGVADDEREREHHPHQCGGQGLGKAVAEQRQHHAADNDEQHDLVGERAEILVETVDRAGVVPHDEQGEGHREADQQAPQHTPAHGDLRSRNQASGVR